MATRTVTRTNQTTTPIALPTARERRALTPATLKLAEFIGRLLPAVVIALALVVGSLVYRVWTQATAALPSSPPGTWLYDLAGRLTAPFAGYESAPPLHEAPAFNLPAVIALDVYLFAGCALLFVTWVARNLVYLNNRPFAVLRTRAAATRRLLPAARRIYRRADAAAEVAYRHTAAASQLAAARLASWLRDRDWAAYRGRTASGLSEARSLTVRGVERISAGARRTQAGASIVSQRSLDGLSRLNLSNFTSGLTRSPFVPPPRSVAWLTDRALVSADRGRRNVVTWTNSGRGPGLLVQAWQRAAVTAVGLSRSQLARSPRSAAWLSERAVASALAGHRRLSSYRAQHGRRAHLAGSSLPGRRMSRRRFLRLPASHA